MEKLALEGGPKVIGEELASHHPGRHWIGEEEKRLVLAALKRDAFSGTLTEDLINFYGCEWAIPTSSGTSALFSAMAALGIGPGMEVIIPGFSWIPTFACVVGRGAIPVLVEVGEDLGIDPEDLEKKITSRTRAVIVVHMAGAAANLDPIMEIARKHDLLVVEDCAQDGAGKYRGKFVGLFGKIGCFSLQQNKHFTSFSGGYMISSHQELEHDARLSNDCGMGRARGSRCPWECRYNKGSNYSYEKGVLPKSDQIFSRGVVMAVPSILTDEQCDKIAEAYHKVAGHLL